MAGSVVLLRPQATVATGVAATAATSAAGGVHDSATWTGMGTLDVSQ
jgi:hypothetical protein